jgi:hypothetical protein
MTLDEDVMRTLQSDASREWRPRDVHAAFQGKTLVQIQYALKKLVEMGAISKRTVGRGVLYRVVEAAKLPADMRVCPACSGRGSIPVDQLPAERAKRQASTDMLKHAKEGEGEPMATTEELVPMEVASVEFVQASVQGEGVCQRCGKASYFTRLLEDGRLLYCCSRGHQMLVPPLAA